MKKWSNARARDARVVKAGRARDTGTLRLLNLFSGCGGMSLGFAREGFSIVGAVELDPLASLSHALNFHRHDGPEARERHRAARDITKTDPDQLARDLGMEDVALAVDVLVGGPPCQSYARVGRAKFREVYEHPQAFKVDPRGNLYLRYLEYVRSFQPLALLVWQAVSQERAMGIEQYTDSIIGLLKKAGVSDEEIAEEKSEEKIGHAFMKGRDWEKTALAILKLHGVEVK